MELIEDITVFDKKAFSDGNLLKLHYWFNDDTHTMDAFVNNKCDAEFLGIINELASIIGADLTIETQPLAEGGLIRWFRIKLKKNNIKDAILVGVLTGILTTIIATPISTSISEVTKHIIEKTFNDSELETLEKEKLKLEIEILKKELLIKNHQIGQNNKIKKRKSNFYEGLEIYKKVEGISLTVIDEEKQVTIREELIERKQFKEFILVSDELEPIENDNAIIEIISPVLKKGKFKWTGIYNGDLIDFNMKSNEFKTLVQTGKVEFKNGSSINCLLKIRRKVDNEGNERITGYDVIRVNKYFENDKPIETPEGRYHRKKNEADKNQLKLYAEFDEDE